MRRQRGRLGQDQQLFGSPGVGPIRDRPHARLVNCRVLAVQGRLHERADVRAANAAQQRQQCQAVRRRGGLVNVQHGLGPFRGLGDLEADLPDRPFGLVAERPFLGFQDDGHQGRNVLRRGEFRQRSQGAGGDHRALLGHLAEQQGHDPGGPARLEHANPRGAADRILLRPQGNEDLFVDLRPVNGFHALPGRLTDRAFLVGQFDQRGQGLHVAHGAECPRGRQTN